MSKWKVTDINIGFVKVKSTDGKTRTETGDGSDQILMLDHNTFGFSFLWFWRLSKYNLNFVRFSSLRFGAILTNSLTIGQSPLCSSRTDSSHSRFFERLMIVSTCTIRQVKIQSLTFRWSQMDEVGGPWSYVTKIVRRSLSEWYQSSIEHTLCILYYSISHTQPNDESVSWTLSLLYH